MSGSVYLLNTDGEPKGVNPTERGHLVAENTLENSIHLGRRFFTASYQAMDADEVLGLLMVPAQSSNGDYVFHTDFEIYGDVSHVVDIFGLPTVSNNGTELTMLNHNGQYQSSMICYTKVYKNPTISDLGFSLFGGLINATKKYATGRTQYGEHVMFEGRALYVRITNSGDAGNVGWFIGGSQIYTGDIL